MLSTCTCMCWSLHANKNNHENLFWFCKHVGYKNHPKEADCCKTICWVNSLQGISKRLFPGWVKSGLKVAFCLPSARRKTQYFHNIFSQPGKSLLEILCIGCGRGLFCSCTDASPPSPGWAPSKVQFGPNSPLDRVRTSFLDVWIGLDRSSSGFLNVLIESLKSVQVRRRSVNFWLRYGPKRIRQG